MVLEGIAPRQGLVCRQERPAAEPVPWYVRAVSAVLRPAVLPLVRRAYRRAEARVSELCRSAGKCASREELELLLGPPKYAMAGNGFESTGPDGSTCSPECVETYVRDRIVLDLWFHANGTRGLSAFVLWSPWDLAVGLPVELAPLNDARRPAASDKPGESRT